MQRKKIDLKEQEKAGEIWGPKRFPKVRRSKDEKQYPPPLPLLVRTENMGSHMKPWVMRRHCTGDGRLILTEEKVRHREFFRAHRSGGRLMLQLVAVEEQMAEEGNATLMLEVAVPGVVRNLTTGTLPLL